MPQRPPKDWWDRCTAGVGGGEKAKPICGSTWYHKMSDKQRREATKRTENPPSGYYKRFGSPVW